MKEELTQPEQELVKIAHRHGWFRTGEMKVGQMRCISCGVWGQEEMPQRTWVGIDWSKIPDEQFDNYHFGDGAKWAEQHLKEKNI